MPSYDWLLALIPIAIIAIWRSLDFKRYKDVDKKIARRSDHGATYQNSQYGSSRDFAALIDAITTQGCANREEQRREDRGRKCREWLTILLIAATFGAIIKQVTEMIKVYDPIARQADIAADSEVKQLRAYVFANVTTPLTNFSVGDKVYSVILGNEGATPAYVLSYNLNAGFVSIIHPTTMTDELRTPTAPRGVPNGDYVFKSHTKQYSSAPFTISPQQSVAILNGTGAIVFLGTITYRDVFGCWHYTSFCVNLLSQRGAPPAQYECVSHNDVDIDNRCDKN